MNQRSASSICTILTTAHTNLLSFRHTHRTVNSTHRTVNSTHHIVNSTHRTVNSTHRTVNSTHHIVNSTHRTVNSTHHIVNTTHRSAPSRRRQRNAFPSDRDGKRTRRRLRNRLLGSKISRNRYQKRTFCFATNLSLGSYLFLFCFLFPI